MHTNESMGGSSPRWRGRRGRARTRLRRRRAHPRVGGDDPLPYIAPPAGMGSSPRWRGRRYRFVRGVDYPVAHPRVGGDDEATISMCAIDVGSSPRWRGRRHVCSSRVVRRGLIPALAGTTGASSPAAPAGWAHPRVGWDDREIARKRITMLGSSLRWRGRPEGSQCMRDIDLGSSPRWRGRPQPMPTW